MRSVSGFILLAVLSWVAWNSINYVTHQPLYADQGVFTSGAMHVLRGRVLYKDICDHKPPMIYVINAASLWLGDGSRSTIWLVERFFADAQH